MMFNDYLPGFRALAEDRMLESSRVTIRRATGRTAQDESTGRESAATTDVANGVPFRLDGSSSGDGGSHTITLNGVEYQQATGVGHLPATLVDLLDNDVLVVTSGEWVGASYRVIEAIKSDQKTARRVPIVEV